MGISKTPQTYADNKPRPSCAIPSQHLSQPSFKENLSSKELPGFTGEKEGTRTLPEWTLETGTGLTAQKDKCLSRPDAGPRIESSSSYAGLFLPGIPPSL